jgi:hypothetical protein
LTTTENKFAEELASFQNLWEGGYMEGDPLKPMAASTYGALGYMSVLHVVYLTCIKPFINQDTVALEIGPGRGAWTKTMLSAKEVWCLDALSPEHNRFWQFIGPAPHIQYYQVSDFSCAMLPDNHFDYMFSFGTLCHISFEGITEYMRNLYPKFRHGAHGFIMIADYDKYRTAWDNLDTLSVINAAKRLVRPENRLIKRIMRPILERAVQKLNMKARPKTMLEISDDNHPGPGRWYHAGVERTCEMLLENGWTIADADVGVLYRDPIIHFRKV